ncbi:Acetyltransferase (GNAT) family protein [Lutispora thermophila DSM 19022]|uniref:Acetyltransferase (GNAT) family protein n=1 Tax=Lutispora thermophila DSM 19022 TaxID=1122184 RepID=A0A1M6E479_9FIRM|nr:Acetyltransferase (GNAT) family protein [Lutispora thermophila DSM 19022]
MEKVILRNEMPSDYRVVEEMTREAFWNNHVPGCDEHYLIHMMRNCHSFIKELDFVAEIDGKVVGNIVYAKSKIMGDKSKYHDVITFGSVSVLPEYQGKGIGAMLI